MTTFDFSAQLAVGDKGEAFLNSYFARWYWIIPVPRELQRFGMDAIYISRASFEVCLVEYKTDWRAGETGNGFIETVSKVESNTAGWAYTSRSHLIFYFVPPLRLIYVIKPADLRNELTRWCSQYRSKDVPNETWITRGVIVPLEEISNIARVIPISEAA